MLVCLLSRPQAAWPPSCLAGFFEKAQTPAFKSCLWSLIKGKLRITSNSLPRSREALSAETRHQSTELRCAPGICGPHVPGAQPSLCLCPLPQAR